ncbi:hypothetical protein AVEN_217345-1 [Araneus ventricosus]|uniref:Uncharacterized protein n=1 Tax=Araneus ventricosus TaxID=182803 RepID=A0A4Y2T5G3_ARAVE|nr:hypothetical protein AVEN_217345-1 [Araneus ventricosus]
MTRTTHELAPSSPSFRTTLAGGRLTRIQFGVQQADIHCCYSVEAGCEPGALRLRSRDLTTRSPCRPNKFRSSAVCRKSRVNTMLGAIFLYFI